jgi:hypothetical protein
MKEQRLRVQAMARQYIVSRTNHRSGDWITGRDYSPTDCPDCLAVPPWEQRCAACAPAEEARRAAMRAALNVRS